MAVFLKNVAKSLFTNVLPQGAAQVLPNVSEVTSRFKADLEKSESILDELKSKTSRFSQASNFAGFKKIHKTALKQLTTGNFGLSQEEQDRELMESLGLGEDTFGGMDSEGDSSSSGDSSYSSYSSGDSGPSGNTIVQKNYYSAGSSGSTEVVGAIATGAVANLGGLASISGVLSEINQSIGALNAFHGEKTSAYYDMSIEASKAIISSQEKQMAEAQKMYDYYKDMQDAKTAKAMGMEGNDIASILDPSRMLSKLNDSMLFSDMSVDIAGSSLGNIMKDPIGFLATTALFGNALTGGRGLIGRMFGDKIDKLEKFASDLPFMAQNKLESWSAGRDYSKSGFSIENLLATIGDTFKLDMGDAKIKLNQDADGPVAFDALTRRSIVTEIPGYLSKILVTLEESRNINREAYRFSVEQAHPGDTHAAKAKRGEFLDRIKDAPSHTIYDNATGKFIREDKLKKQLAQDVEDINLGNGFGGFGSKIDSVVGNLDMSKDETKYLKKQLTDLAGSNLVGNVDWQNSDSIAENLRLLMENTIKANKGESDEAFAERKRATIDYNFKQSNFGDNLKKMTAFLNDNSSADAIVEARLSQFEKERIQKEGLTEPERAAARKEYEKLKKSLEKQKADGTLSSNITDDFKSSAIRHSYDVREKARRFGVDNERTALGKVATLNGDLTEIQERRIVTGSNKADADKIRSALDRMKRGLKAREGIEADQRADGTSGGAESGGRSFFDKFTGSISKFFSNLEDKVSSGFDRFLLTPMKKFLLGKENADAAKETSFFDALKTRFDASVLFPLKKMFLGKDAKDDKVSQTGFFKAMGQGFDRTILMPLKKVMLGPNKDPKKHNIFESMKVGWERTVLMPIKTFLLGDKKQAAKFGFWQSLEKSWTRNVTLPIKTWMLGGKKGEAAKTGFFEAAGIRFNKMLGFDDKKAKELTVFKAMAESFDKKLMQPLKGWLFGDGNKEKSFFKNITDWMGPRINKLIFGDKAQNNTLWGNIKQTFKDVGDFLSNKVFKPVKDWFTKELVPSMKDFFKEVGDSLKEYVGKIKNFFTKDLVKGAKGIMNDILGDDTIKKIRENVVDPFKNAVSKLTESLGGVLRFFMRIPVNFFKGVADSLKLKKLKSGRATYSDEETARLKALDEKGTTFDFMAGVKKEKKAEQASPVDAKSPAQTAKEAMTPPADVAQKFGEAGANAGQGFVEGLNSQTDKVAEASKAIGDAAEEALKKDLDIHSPSRVMKKIGEFTAQGFIEGLRSKMGEVSSTLKQMVSGKQAGKIDANVAHSVSAGDDKGKIADMVKEAHKTTVETKSTNAILEKIHGFMEGNLREVDATAIKILNAISKGGSGNGNAQLGSSPLGWLGQKLDALLKGPFKMLQSIADGATNLIKGFKDLPKQILSGIGNIVSNITDTLGKILPNITDLAGKVMDKFGDVVKKGADTFINITDKLLRSGLDVVSKIGNAIKPLTDALIDVGTHFVKSLKPAFEGFGKALGFAIEGVSNFTMKLMDAVGQLGGKLLDWSSKYLGITFGKRSGMLGADGTVKAQIVGWSALGSSKANPLFVHVVDGEIATYSKKKRGVTMTDNVEDVTAAAKSFANKAKPDEEEKKDDGLLGTLKDAAGTAMGALGGSAIGKAVGGIANKAGGMINIGRTSIGDKLANAKDIVSKSGSSLKGKIGEMTVDQLDAKMAKLNPDSSLYKKLAAQKELLQGSKVEQGKSFLRRTFWSEKPMQKDLVNKAAESKVFQGAKGLVSKAGTKVAESGVGRVASAVANSVPGRAIGAVGRGTGKVLGAVGRGVKYAANPANIGKGLTMAGKATSGLGSVGTKVITKPTGMIGNAISNAGSRAGSALTSLTEKTSGKAGGTILGKVAGSAVSGLGKVAGTGVKAVGQVVGQVGVNMPAKLAGGAMNMAGKAMTGITNTAGKMAGAVAKIGTKGLTIGGIVGGLGEVISDSIFEKGGHAHKIFTNSFSALGGASTGAMIGSMILPGVGTVIGGVIGAIASGLTSALGGIKDWLEDKFKDEIQSATTYFLEFPNKLGAWIDALPEKVNAFAEQLPDKIMSFFSTPTEADIDPNTGLPVQQKPSILWKMIEAIGTAGVSLIAQAPKLAITLGEALTKILTSAVITAGGFLFKGVVKIGNVLQNAVEDNIFLPIKGGFDKMMIKLGAFFSDLFEDGVGGTMNRFRDTLANFSFSIMGHEFKPFSSFAVSESEKAEIDAKRKKREGELNEKLSQVDKDQEKYKLDRAKRQEAALQAVDDGTKSAIRASNNFIGSIANGAKEMTGANAAAEWGRNVGKADRNQNRYEMAMQAAKGDEKKAMEEYAKANLITEEEATKAKADGTYDKLVAERTAKVAEDANWQAGKTSYGKASTAANEERYKVWLKSQGLTDNEVNRAKYDTAVEAEQKGKSMTMAGKAFGRPEVEDAITKASNVHGIPRDLMAKMAIIESGMDPNASRGEKGAKGLYQFIPSTAAAYGIAGRELDPYANADAAARLFKDNIKLMNNAGVPVNPTTMYLAHQQGAGGVNAIWKAAQAGTAVMSDTIRGNMANNDPFGKGQLRDPKAFIAAWEKKLGEDGTLAKSLGVTSEMLAQVQTDKRVTALAEASTGSPAAPKTQEALVAATTANGAYQARPTFAANAAQGGTQIADATTPAKKANDAAASAAPAAAPVVAAAAAPAVTASPAQANGNVMAAAAPNAAGSGMAVAAAQNSVAEKQMTSAIQSALTSQTPTSSDPMLAELRQQTTLLSAIAGNTKEMGGVTANMVTALNSVQQGAAAEATKVADASGSGNSTTNVRMANTDIFGNVRNNSPVLRPSMDALRIAAGGNLPNTSPIAV